MKKVEGPITELKKNISLEVKTIKELQKSYNSLTRVQGNERKKVIAHITELEDSLIKIKNNVISQLENFKMNNLIPNSQPEILEEPELEPKVVSLSEQVKKREIEIYQNKSEQDEIEEENELEKETLKRIKKKEKITQKKKIKKPSLYVKKANKMFATYSRQLVDKGYFRTLERDLIKASLEFVPSSYVSVMLYTTLISIGVGFLLFLFFLFFNISSKLPIITLVTEDFGARFLKTFWLIIVAPILTFFSMYIYPSLEKRSAEGKINHELPFATIHMAAISGSLIEPSKIFKIVVSTGEYPAVTKEFTKLLNQINVFGYDLVGALRNQAFNSPSRKLADLFNSLATTINSGGDLPEFFNKRAESLLFEHRLEREKETKSSETFMDIYISVVIAAPMILMLLLMMIKIGGLGLALSTGAITLSMVLGVTVVNIIFLAFLHLKQPEE